MVGRLVLCNFGIEKLCNFMFLFYLFMCILFSDDCSCMRRNLLNLFSFIDFIFEFGKFVFLFYVMKYVKVEEWRLICDL